MTVKKVNRRAFIKGAGAVAVGSFLQGCGENEIPTPDPNPDPEPRVVNLNVSDINNLPNVTNFTQHQKYSIAVVNDLYVNAGNVSNLTVFGEMAQRDNVTVLWSATRSGNETAVVPTEIIPISAAMHTSWGGTNTRFASRDRTPSGGGFVAKSREDAEHLGNLGVEAPEYNGEDANVSADNLIEFAGILQRWVQGGGASQPTVTFIEAIAPNPVILGMPVRNKDMDAVKIISGYANVVNRNLRPMERDVEVSEDLFLECGFKIHAGPGANRYNNGHLPYLPGDINEEKLAQLKPYLVDISLRTDTVYDARMLGDVLPRSYATIRVSEQAPDFYGRLSGLHSSFRPVHIHAERDENGEAPRITHETQRDTLPLWGGLSSVTPGALVQYDYDPIIENYEDPERLPTGSEIAWQFHRPDPALYEGTLRLEFLQHNMSSRSVQKIIASRREAKKLKPGYVALMNVYPHMEPSGGNAIVRYVAPDNRVYADELIEQMTEITGGLYPFTLNGREFAYSPRGPFTIVTTQTPNHEEWVRVSDALFRMRFALPSGTNLVQSQR